MSSAGPLAFVGGGEWREGCTFDRALLEASGAKEVLILPTAAAYEHPQRAVEAAQQWFSELGVEARGLNLLHRRDAETDENAAAIRAARFIYLSDGSPLHLRSVLKGSKAWAALEEAWRSGAALAGSSAGAMIFGDPMVDPRGGAFTLGLGLVRKFAFIPHWEQWTGDRIRRMTHLIPAETVVAEVQERTALIRWADGTWTTDGAGKATVSYNRQPLELTGIGAVVETEPMAVPVTP